MNITKVEVVDGTTSILQAAQQDLRLFEERLSRTVVEGRLPHATELRVHVYAALAASATASRELQLALAMVSERLY